MKFSLRRGPRFKVGNTPRTASSWQLTEYFKCHIKEKITQHIFTIFIYQVRKLFIIEPWNLEYLFSTLSPSPATIPWGKYEPHLTFQQKMEILTSDCYMIGPSVLILYIDRVTCIFPKLCPQKKSHLRYCHRRSSLKGSFSSVYYIQLYINSCTFSLAVTLLFSFLFAPLQM